MDTTPIWFDGEDVPKHKALDRDVTCDVCVVGAGFSGLSAAYFLAREGKSVVVLDSRNVAAGDSGNTTAHVTAALDRRFSELESAHGLEHAKLAVSSHIRAITEI